MHFCLLQLRMRRLTSLNMSKTISDKDRGNLMKVLQTNEYISSEESEAGSAPSGSDGEDTEPKEATKVLVKRRLLWRSEYVNDLFVELDKRTEKRRRRSQKGGACAMKRRVGGASTREKPEDCEDFASVAFEEP